MMFTLYEQLETEIEINGHVYEVDMSFDNIILFLEMMNDMSLSDVEKVYHGIYLLLGIELDTALEIQVKLFESLIQNLIHSDDKSKTPVDLEGNIMPLPKQQQNYCLKYDAEYIYTSFKQAYQIDLLEEQGKLDWRKFKLLLRDLPDDTKLKQVIDIRTKDYPKGKHSGEERRKLKELKRAFALPGTEID